MAVIDNLIVSYDQSETTGNAVDSHTNAYTMTETGGTIGSDTGPAGTANTARVYVDTDTEYFRIENASSPLLDITGDLSIVAWVWLDRNDVTQRVVSRFDNGGAGSFAYDLSYSNTGAWSFRVASGSGFANFTGVSSDLSFANGVWRMVTARHDSGTEISIDLNNDLSPNTTAYTHGLWDANAPLEMGRDMDGSYYHGRLAQVRIWTKLLTDAEQTWLYNSGAGRTYAEIVAEAGGGTRPVTMAGPWGGFAGSSGGFAG
jgi:hypothetical protein